MLKNGVRLQHEQEQVDQEALDVGRALRDERRDIEQKPRTMPSDPARDVADEILS